VRLFSTLDSLLRGVPCTCCVQLLLYSCILSKTGVVFNSFAVSIFVLWPFKCLSLSDELHFDFCNSAVGNPVLPEWAEPRDAFKFNDAPFGIGCCSDGTAFQKFVSATLVFSGKSVSKSVFSGSTLLAFP
jgi:hypothetical protein